MIFFFSSLGQSTITVIVVTFKKIPGLLINISQRGIVAAIFGLHSSK